MSHSRPTPPPAARYAVVSNPGTDRQRVENYTQTIEQARGFQTCYDEPTDVMRVTPTGELTTEF